MWVANSDVNTVTKLSLAGVVLATYAAGQGPQGIAFDGTSMWVTDFTTNNVTKL